MNTRTGNQGGHGRGGRTWARAGRLLAGLIVVNSLLLAPEWVFTGRVGPSWLAYEALGLTLVAGLLPRSRWAVTGLACSAAVLTALTIVAFADALARMSLSRPLNLYIDFWLVSAVGNLLAGMLGQPMARIAIVVAATATVVLPVVVTLLLLPAGSARNRLRERVGLAAAIAGVSLGLTAERIGSVDLRIDAPAVRTVREQSARFVDATQERARFEADVARAPADYRDVPGLLRGLDGTDVILAFVESYGVAALYDDRYAPVVGPRLDDLEVRVREAGLHLASGRLVAPSQGGQSWYGHGTTLSGLWLDNQIRYNLMLASGRPTLVDDFEAVGYRTVALMPQITMAWPEGERFGYEQIYAKAEIGYRGPALNWVTMPDQFTWHFLQNTIRAGDDRPLFAEIGLISSHAPWTPILPVLDDWDAIGTGEIFAPWEHAGERPEDLWRDSDRVREHYAMSVEYAVHAMTAFAERYVDDETLLIVLGDHQPAPLVTGEGAPWDVPVHVISGEPTLLEPFLEWGFVPGAWPDTAPETEVLGMDYFRDWFIRAFSRPTMTSEAAATGSPTDAPASAVGDSSASRTGGTVQGVGGGARGGPHNAMGGGPDDAMGGESDSALGGEARGGPHDG